MRSESLEARVLLSLSSLFQIDGNAATTVTSPISHDWDQVYHDKGGTVSPDPGPSGTGALQFSPDPINSASDDTFTSSSKDTADINTWSWTSSKPNSKSDLEHGFAAAYQDEGYSTNGSVHTLLYVGADRYDNVGSSTLGVWFLHNPIAKSGTTSGGFVFKGTNTPYTHSDGDVLFVANFASGAVSFTAYKWNSVTKTIPSVGTPLTSDQGLAFANASPVSVPWAYTTKSGKTSPQANQFLEFGVDLNQLFATSGASLPDFSSYIISTRTSNSATATLQDFIIRDVSSAPDVAVTKTPDAPTVNAGSKVGYTVSVSNVGVGNLSGVTFNDPLPAGAASDLSWTFASGGNPGGLFQITGSVGNQVLSLISPQNMAFNAAPIVAHVVANSSISDLGKISSTATVTAIGEGSNFLTNNTATADIVIMPVAVNDTYFTPLNVTLTVPASGVLSNDGTPLTNVTAVLVSGPSQGSLTMNANGDGGFTYSPARNSSSTATFTYKDSLLGNLSNIATVTINIGANHPPVTVNDSNSVTEDSVLTASGNVLSNDSDVDGGTTLAATLVGSGTGTYGSLTMSSSGGYTYTLNNAASVVQALAAGQVVTDAFTYAASDGIASTNGTLTITINGTNDGPVAVNDAPSTSEDTFVDLLVVSNDTDSDSPNSALVVAAGSIANVHGGIATLQPDGHTVRFTPAANANSGNTPGGFGFDYKVSDGSLTSANTGTVTITVNAANDTPAAVNDAASTSEDTFVDLVVVANDTDSDSSNSVLVVAAGSITNVHGGTATLQPDGRTVRFTPAADANGGNTPGGFGFDYKVSDGSLTSANTGVVTITVSATNDAPVTMNDAASTNEDTFVDVVVVANDTDIDSANSVLVVAAGSISNVHGGTATLQPDGRTVRFTPATDANSGNAPGGFGFDYKVSDGSLTSANTGTVTITINSANDAPVAVNDAGTATEAGGVNNTTPGSDATGNVLINDTDVDAGDTKTVATLSGGTVGLPLVGAHGSLTLNSDGSFSYSVNNADAAVQSLLLSTDTLTDIFSYTIRDAAGAGSNSANLVITIHGQNDAPTVGRDSASVTVAENAFANNTGTFADDDGMVTIAASCGSVAQDNAVHTWSWSFSPADGPDDGQTVTITATDSVGAVTSTTFSLIVNNVPPSVILSGPSAADESQTKSYTFTTSDPGQDTFSVVEISGGSTGTVSNLLFNSATGAGSFDVTFSNGGVTSTVSVQVKDSDNDNSNVSSIDVTVATIEPTIAISGAASVNEGSTYSLTLGGVTDPGGSTVTSYIVHWGDGSNDTYSLNGDQTHTYTDGAATFAITVNLVDADGTHLDQANALSISVLNAEPTVSISGSTTVEALTAYALILDGVTDPGLDTVTTYIVHWGDGNSDTYSTLGVKAHTYSVSQTAIITVDLVDEDGLFLDQANPLIVTVTEPVVRRFDFNAVSGHGITPNDTQSGFIGVNGSKLYADGDGYGFLSVVDDYSRGQSTVTTKTSKALYEDFVRGTSAGTFQLSVPVDQVYNLSFYSGDTGFAHDHLRITIEGGDPVPFGKTGIYAKTASATAKGAWTTVSFTDLEDLDNDGILTIVFSDLTVSGTGTATYEPYRWVVNGLDIWWVDNDGNPSTDLNAPGMAPLISGNAAATLSSDVGFTNAALAPIVTEAIARWSATGLTSAQVAMLKAVTFQIIDLDTQRQLGSASEAEGKIQLDDNANGHGWFVDSTKRDNREFTRRGLTNELTALPNGPAAGHMDLLTVVMHEMGHILGHDHTTNPHSLMAEELSTGLRRLPFRETPFAMASIAVGTGHLTAKSSQVTTPAVTASTSEPPTFMTKPHRIAVESQLSGNDLKRDDDRDAVFAGLMRIFDNLEMI